jgi:hypothetical protein
MKKFWLIAFICVFCGTTCFGRTNIFGGKKQITAMYGSESVVAKLGCEPAGGFRWGATVQGELDSGFSDTHAKWEDTFLGLYIEHPVLSVETVYEALPIKGEGYAGASLLINPETNTDLYLVLEGGVKAVIRENKESKIKLQACIQYSKRDKLMKNSTRALIGPTLEW